MKRVYISLYNKENIEEIAEKFIKAGWEILSSHSTWKYLTYRGISTSKIETDIHPNLAIIQSLTSKNIYKIPNINLIIADIPEDLLSDEVYNLILIIFALRKNIPVITSLEKKDFINQIEIFGDISKNTKEELENLTLNYISFIFSKQAYLKFPYINEKLKEITLPLKKIKDLSYGENPHQKSYLYQTFLKSIDFETIIGELNTNHLLDIKKSIDIMNEIDSPFLMSIDHSNISSFLWGNKIIDFFNKGNKEYCVVYNGFLGYELFEAMVSKGTRFIISRGFDEDSIKLAKEINKKEKIILIKITSHIRPPKEFDIFFLGNHAIIQEKNVYQSSLNIYGNKKLSNDDLEKIKIGYSIVKNLKTFSASILTNNQIIALNQGEPSAYEALKNLFLKITDTRNYTAILKNLGKFTVVIDGTLTKDMIKIIENCPIDFIASQNIDDQDTINQLEKKNIIFVKFDKRIYKHF